MAVQEPGATWRAENRGAPIAAAPLPWITESDDRRFDDVVERSSIPPLLVDLWAPWCGPCPGAIKLALEKVAEDLAGRLKLVKVNVDEANGHCEAPLPSVQGIPTLLLMRDGKEVDRQVGALPEAALRRVGPTGAAQSRSRITRWASARQ